MLWEAVVAEAWPADGDVSRARSRGCERVGDWDNPRAWQQLELARTAVCCWWLPAARTCACGVRAQAAARGGRGAWCGRVSWRPRAVRGSGTWLRAGRNRG